MPRITYDEIAFRQLIGTGKVDPKLVQDARYAVGAECPECGCESTEGNGMSEYRCCGCDHRWGIDGGERYGF